jgi:hypothetical protein
VQDLVDNISSPIETASLIKSLNVPFSQKHLAPTKDISRFNTGHSKAFYLGILGADLGYLNMYGKTGLIMNYITSMKSLAEDINIGQFFDYSTLKRLSTNNKNIDSLIYISQQSFNKMDRHLQRTNRGNLSALMICGVWVEAFYLTCQFYKEHSEPRLAESIGENKVLFDELMKLLKNYQSEKYVADLIAELMPFQELYDNMTLTIKEGEPLTMEENGTLTFVQTETSTVHYTDKQMTQILSLAETIRNKLIQ